MANFKNRHIGKPNAYESIMKFDELAMESK